MHSLHFTGIPFLNTKACFLIDSSKLLREWKTTRTTREEHDDCNWGWADIQGYDFLILRSSPRCEPRCGINPCLGMTQKNKKNPCLGIW